jgi:ribonucleoside-diphosphate reductase alpha chain
VDGRSRKIGALVSPKTCLCPIAIVIGLDLDASREGGWVQVGARDRLHLAASVVLSFARGGEGRLRFACTSCARRMPLSRFFAAHRGSARVRPEDNHMLNDTMQSARPIERVERRASADSSYPQSTMRVKKRNGSSEPVDVNKIVRAVNRCCAGLESVDALRVATKTISGLYDGASTRELDQLSIQTSAGLIVEEPEYARLAARLLSTYVDKEVRGQGIHAFSQAILTASELGLVNDRLAAFVAANARKLNDAIVPERDREFEYFGLRTLYDRYLSKHPATRSVVESPQYFFMRIACALSESVPEAIELYTLFSKLEYLPSSPTLFNSGTRHEQLSSCFLLDSPGDHLADIYRTYTDVALLSKFSGGIGLAYHRVRSRGSLIESTNGHSNGIVPWLKTLDASVAAVNQGGKRKGACCVYLEPWHADIEEFLELRDNTGDEARRTHNLNLANWICDLFMRRVESDESWSLFDPKAVPHLPDLFGDAFDAAYEQAERDGLAAKTVRARELYARMMRTLAQTGNGWMTFKDKSNRACNQTATAGRTVHLSNLCTEILEVTSRDETAVCNLGSVNLARHSRRASDGALELDFDKLARTVRTAVFQLDRVIDLNYYTIPSARTSNMRWRPVGLGLMGLQDLFFQMRLPFDAPEARELSQRISEEVYFHALSASVELAIEKGRHEAFAETRAARGELQFDAWGVKPGDAQRWEELRERVREHGLRNSLIVAIAPTATIASIAGCYECIEPQVSNLFKRETLSGDFLQINRYLVTELKEAGLWNESMRTRLKLSEGSVQDMLELPEHLRAVYRTAWEIPMRSLVDMAADRGAFIDQSQSLNLFVESPNIGQLSSMYFYAWKRGLKTTYYLRSRPATRIAKATVSGTSTSSPRELAAFPEASAQPPALDVAAVVCSLENPETCEACQ